MSDDSSKTGRPSGSRPANKRGAARLGAVQALYQMEIGGVSLEDVLTEFEAYRLGREVDGETYRDADPVHFRSIVTGVVEEQRALDPALNDALTPGWPLARLDALLRALLRCGAYELIRRADIPPRVVISEYLDVARAFYDGDEPKLVNGVLNSIAHKARGDELEPPAVKGA